MADAKAQRRLERQLANAALLRERSKAVRRGDLDAVRAALGAGARPDHAPRDSACVLGSAAADGRLDVVDALLQAGAAVDGPVASRPTPLFEAAEAGHGAVVAALLAAGADPDRRWEGLRPLDAASRGRHAEAVRALGGDPSRMGVVSARGLGSEDVEEDALLVGAGVEATAEGFGGLLGAERWEQNVHGRAIVPGALAWVVYRLRDHAWTLALLPGWSEGRRRARDARQRVRLDVLAEGECERMDVVALDR